jgi:hypothetical protein
MVNGTLDVALALAAESISGTVVKPCGTFALDDASTAPP